MFAQCPNLPNFDTAQTGSSMAVSQEEGGYLTKPKQKNECCFGCCTEAGKLIILEQNKARRERLVFFCFFLQLS